MHLEKGSMLRFRGSPISNINSRYDLLRLIKFVAFNMPRGTERLVGSTYLSELFYHFLVVSNALFFKFLYHLISAFLILKAELI